MLTILASSINYVFFQCTQQSTILIVLGRGDGCIEVTEVNTVTKTAHMMKKEEQTRSLKKLKKGEKVTY